MFFTTKQYKNINSDLLSYKMIKVCKKFVYDVMVWHFQLKLLLNLLGGLHHFWRKSIVVSK